jgi:hypothetical protein
MSNSGTTISDNGWLDEARAVLGADVVAVCPLNHTGFGTRKALSVATRHLGVLPSLLARAASKKVSATKAGGLPEHFLLVVTPDRAVAHDYKGYPGRKLRIEPEPAASWERSSLRVTADPGRMFTKVILEGPGEVERAECQVGTSEFAQDFVALLRS